MIGITPLFLSRVWTDEPLRTQEEDSLEALAARVSGLKFFLAHILINLCCFWDYLFHQYGTNEDWDRLSKITGDAGWSWNNMRPYIQKVGVSVFLVHSTEIKWSQHEKFVPPVDGHNTTGQFIPSLHGFNGVTSVSLPGFNQTIDPMVLEATKQRPDLFPFNEDTSGGDHSLLGIGFLQSSAGQGSRSSSSTSYLAQANSRPNLTVLINTTVLKLLQSPQATSNAVPSFRKVQIAASPGTASTSAGEWVDWPSVKLRFNLSSLHI